MRIFCDSRCEFSYQNDFLFKHDFLQLIFIVSTAFLLMIYAFHKVEFILHHFKYYSKENVLSNRDDFLSVALMTNPESSMLTEKYCDKYLKPAIKYKNCPLIARHDDINMKPFVIKFIGDSRMRYKTHIKSIVTSP